MGIEQEKRKRKNGWEGKAKKGEEHAEK